MMSPQRPKLGVLQRLALWAHDHYRAVFVGFGILLLVALALASRLRFDTDVLNLLPRKDPVINAYMDTLRDFGTFDYLMITVRLPEGATVAPYESFVDRLGERLEVIEQVSSVDYRIGEPIELVESFFPYALLFLDQAGRAALTERLSDEGIERRVQDLKRLLTTPQALAMKDLVKIDPFGIAQIVTGGLTARRGGLAIDWSSGYFLSKDRQVLLLLVKPNKAPQNIAFDRELVAATQMAIDSTLAEWEEIAGTDGPPTPTVRSGGPYVTALIDAAAIQGDMTVNMVSSMALVLLLFLIAFRRLGPLTYAFVPLAAGLVLTFGFSAIAFGTLSTATSGTAALLIGLGIDFIIVSYGRFVEERNAGAGFETALAKTMGTSGRAVVVGAVTTAATFYAFTFTDFRGLRQMGVLTGTGILLCMAAVLLLLPAMLAWSEDHSRRRRRAPRLYLHSFGSERVIALCMRHPRLVLAIGLLVTVGAATQLHRLSFEDNWRSMRPAGNEGVEVEHEVAESFDSDFDFMMLVLEGEEIEPLLERTAEVSRKAQALVDSGVMNGVSSVTSFVPPPSAQREALEWLKAGRDDGRLDMQRIRATFSQALVALNRRVEPFGRGLDLLERALAADQPVRVEDFGGNRQVRQLLDRALLPVESGWKSVVYLYPPAEVYRRQAPQEVRDLAEEMGEDVMLTGANLVNERMRKRVRRDAWVAALLGTFIVGLLLWLDFRSLRAAILALMPLAVGVIWMLGGMVLLGIAMNFMNIFVTTMIIGIGVDYGLHMVHRYYEVRKTTVGRIYDGLRRTGNAIVVAALSTMVGFGSMSLSQYPGLRTTGYVAILGAALTAVVAITLLPAYLSLRVQRRLGEFPPASTADPVATTSTGS